MTLSHKPRKRRAAVRYNARSEGWHPPVGGIGDGVAGDGDVERIDQFSLPAARPGPQPLIFRSGTIKV